MAIEIEILSKEIIKPLKYHIFKPYKLCLIDQKAPPIHTPIVFFYSSPENHSNPKTCIHNTNNIQTLKLSLSKTLETYYPFAGRLSSDGAFVETGPNDGALFKEARVVGMDLATAVEKPDASLLERLLPIHPYKSRDEIRITLVQSNSFRCGGIALGICVSHKIADAASISAFLSAWAASSVGCDVAGTAVPFDTAEVIFPPIPGFRSDTMSAMIQPGEIVARRFAFDAASLARLRTEASSGSTVPSRVQAVTALISGTAARTKTTCPATTEAVLHIVNLRPRISPPLPEKTIGNIWTAIMATVSNPPDGGDHLSNMVAEMRRELKKVDPEKLETEESFGVKVERLTSDSSASFMKFSSWVTFGFYEVDFGFGRPEGVVLTASPMDGAVFLTSDKSGSGIDAWVNLDTRHMASFETDKTLLNFAFFALDGFPEIVICLST